MNKIAGKKGFTLIELLVVIAIIAILAAILFPVFTSAKESARKAACASNMKQMGNAMMLYMQNWGDKIPLSFCWNYDNPDEGNTFVSYLRPYTKSLAVFSCPSMPAKISDYWWTWKTSYFVTDCILQENSSIVKNGKGYWYSDRKEFLSVSRFKRPTKTVILMDCKFLDGTSTSRSELDYSAMPKEFSDILNLTGYQGRKIGEQFARHKRSANCAFVDGHAQSIPCGKFTPDMFTFQGN